ncbi:MAG: hypothetical protein GQ532_15355 [Methylomarinum sp.]|nr:hypothetical protein [Methylomarinum sp.]
MTFINEYVSENDIKKYGLEEIQLSYNPAYRKRGFSSAYKYMWTIDRERETYLMRCRSGREEFSNRVTWVMNLQGELITIETDLAGGGSHSYKEKPYIKIWDLVSIESSAHIQVEHQSIIQLLKEALMIYGDSGANSYVDDVIVKFNF